MFNATLLFVLVLVNPATTQAGGEMPRAAKATAVIVNLAVINGVTHFVAADNLHCVLRVFSDAACYKNRYYLIRWLERQSKMIPLKERKERASMVANKVAHRLANLEEIKFNMKGIFYWLENDDPWSRLPIRMGKYRHKATVKLVQTLTRMRTEIIIGGLPLYTLFLGEDWAFTEYKWPDKEYAKYPYDSRYFVLDEGVEPRVLCLTGTYRKIWIGGDSAAWLKDRVRRGIPAGTSMSSIYRRLIGEGLWIGQATIRGETCDVVQNRWESDDPLIENVFFVNNRGILLRREIIFSTATSQMFIEAMDYEHLDGPVKVSELLPPKLTEEWKEREVVVQDDGTLKSK